VVGIYSAYQITSFELFPQRTNCSLLLETKKIVNLPKFTKFNNETLEFVFIDALTKSGHFDFIVCLDFPEYSAYFASQFTHIVLPEPVFIEVAE